MCKSAGRAMMGHWSAVLNMKTPLASLAFLLAFGSQSAAIVPATTCGSEYYAATAPDVLNERLLARLTELCYRDFVVFHSGLTATPLWVAEHLTATEVAAARAVDRVNVFHSEKRLPRGDRAELEHYRGSGYDRGHLAPAADMSSKQAQDESFTLANMIPQLPRLNRQAWAEVEESVRELATRYGDVHVITGAAFLGKTIGRIGGRVIVPSSVYKAVYLPATGQASAWWADNATGRMELLSIDELAARVGIVVFPTLPKEIRQRRVALPMPSDAAEGRRDPLNVDTTEAAQAESSRAAAVRLAIEAAERVLSAR